MTPRKKIRLSEQDLASLAELVRLRARDTVLVRARELQALLDLYFTDIAELAVPGSEDGSQDEEYAYFPDLSVAAHALIEAIGAAEFVASEGLRLPGKPRFHGFSTPEYTKVVAERLEVTEPPPEE